MKKRTSKSKLYLHRETLHVLGNVSGGFDPGATYTCCKGGTLDCMASVDVCLTDDC